MTRLHLRALMVAVLMCATAAFAYVARPSVHLTDKIGKPDLETMFPKSFGSWSVDERMPVQLVSPDQLAVLNAIYNQTLSRTYVSRDGQRIMLSVAYGGDQSDGTRAHRPEVCYPAQGFELRSNRRGTVAVGAATIDVRMLMSRLGSRHEPITYWVVVGDKIATSGTEQKLAQLSYGVRGVIPDGLLVRISNIGADEFAGYALHARFIADLAGHLGNDARRRIFGDSGSTPD